MRSFLFNLAYWVLSIAYTLMAALCALAPGREAVGWAIRRYVRRMVQAMRILAGIRLEVRGKERLPEGAFIIAAKHQSWGDGFCDKTQNNNQTNNTNDQQKHNPQHKTKQQKQDAIVVDN